MIPQLRPLSYALGAEITGINIQNPINDEECEYIHTAFLKYCVLLFRGQKLTREQHIQLTRRFGEIEDHRGIVPHVVRDLQDEKILTKKSPEAAAQVWHSDRSFMLVPTMATLLRGVQLPDVGGDTMFCNMYLAYDALSIGMKRLIGGLYGVHPTAKLRLDFSTPERLAETKRFNPPIAQPLVRIHPETQRKSLFLEEKVQLLVGMTKQESEPLIKYLCEHAARPQFVYRHQWQQDDLIIWDNRCTNHIAVADFDRTQIRHTEKTCVKGTPSGYVYDGPLEVSYY